MRFVPIILFALSTLGLIYLDNPQPTRQFFINGARALERTLMQKRVTIAGLQSLHARELTPELPLDHSVIWWALNGDQIEARLKRNAVVKSARLRSCTKWMVSDWGCFVIDVQERSPRYVALFNGQIWVLGDDGGFLFPVEQAEYDRLPIAEIIAQRMGARAPRVESLIRLSAKGDSPDVVQARLRYTREALEIIQESSGLPAEEARCTVQGEVRVRFAGFPFEAIFDFAEAEPEKLRQEGRRLNRLVREFGPRLKTVELIDLAYNKLAVVRFQETPGGKREAESTRNSSDSEG